MIAVLASRPMSGLRHAPKCVRGVRGVDEHRQFCIAMGRWGDGATVQVRGSSTPGLEHATAIGALSHPLRVLVNGHQESAVTDLLRSAARPVKVNADCSWVHADVFGRGPARLAVELRRRPVRHPRGCRLDSIRSGSRFRSSLFASARRGDDHLLKRGAQTGDDPSHAARLHEGVAPVGGARVGGDMNHPKISVCSGR